MYDVKEWSVFDCFEDEIQRTNNAIEGYHNRLSYKLLEIREYIDGIK